VPYFTLLKKMPPIVDAFSDALGIHISEKAECTHMAKQSYQGMRDAL